MEISFPVHYTGIPHQISLSNKLPEKINLRLEDKGMVFMYYYFKKNHLSVKIDLGNISLSTTSSIVSQAALSNLISKQLYSSTELKSFSPSQIEVSYSPLASKELPVTIDGNLSLAPGYIFLDSPVISPPVIMAYGNKKTLDNLQVIKTQPFHMDNIGKQMDLNIHLSVPEGVTLSTEQIRLTAKVEEYTEKTFTLPVICSNSPQDRIVRFFPSYINLSVQIGLSKYSKVKESDFEIQVDYKRLIANHNKTYPLTITRKPEWLKNYRIQPEFVDYIIEQK